jgi:hypothetical protein
LVLSLRIREAPNEYKTHNLLKDKDTCNYNLLSIVLTFKPEILPHETCSTPHDSLVGYITDINIIVNDDYNEEYKAGDTINTIINIVYNSQNAWPTDTPITLNDYIISNPNCSFAIYAMLTSPPEISSEVSFSVIYREESGSEYTGITNNVIIKE